ncbi:MAG TPA: vWA domain-containing protein [Polyangiaceae bacterium]|nr:vWA domain-containing protein [Polyangiaceae bacterium]
MSGEAGRLAPAALLVLFALTTGCSLFGGVRVETLASSTQKPSNVALYVGVTEGDQPLTDLEAKNFHIYENGQELDPKQVGRMLLSRDLVTHERVLLLVDLSGNPSPERRAEYVQAVEAFVRKLRESLPVSVRAYDGSPGLKAVGDYPRGSTTFSAAPLLKASSKDQSRDLNGAVVAGLAELDRAAQGNAKPVELATLVVFAGGPDLAGRTSDDKLYEALEQTKHDVIGIGVGEDVPYLSFARGGVIHSQNADTLPIAFEEAGARVAATHAKYYLVAYCSPARAGKRSVRLEVVHENKDGDERSGSTDLEIDATGFGPGCSSETTPRFERPRTEARAEGDEGGARLNKSKSTDTGAVVPPPDTGEYAK